MVTLEGEREDAKWILLGVTVKVQAREGESITAPATDFRQERSAGGFGNYEAITRWLFFTYSWQRHRAAVLHPRRDKKCGVTVVRFLTTAICLLVKELLSNGE